MTTEELAKLIGVSRVTVSKVINGAGGVSEKTAQKVREYIEKYNFVPNSGARSLVGKPERIIGLFSAYSESNSGAGENITSHFATEMINLVVSEAQKRGYKTLVQLTSEDDEIRSIEHILASRMVSGAILLGYDTGNRDVLDLAERDYPLVLVNQERDSFRSNVAVVNMDDQASAFFAISKLVQYGHKDILYLGCGRHRLPAMHRHEGVSSAKVKFQESLDRLTEIDCNFDEQRAYEEVRAIYSSEGAKPTGIFAANDIMAIGAMNALKDLGYSIPADVSVIGFDDISISRYLSPKLTTMHCDFKRIASACVDSLISLIDGKDTQRHKELPVEFVERETLGYAKR
ncbi:MAG: LacI family DNA-binding transcriptional regulator [Spirochaetales bacterium]|nr:LacI family DNA-binding transcriptional regulator [Spirochaetales bacterium]